MADITRIESAPRSEKATLQVGARDGCVMLAINGTALSLSPEQADDLSASLRRFALEIRHGGAVPGLTAPLDPPTWEDEEDSGSGVD